MGGWIDGRWMGRRVGGSFFHCRRVRAWAAAVSTLELRFGELGGCPRQAAGHSEGQMGWSRKWNLPEIYPKFLAGMGSRSRQEEGGNLRLGSCVSSLTQIPVCEPHSLRGHCWGLPRRFRPLLGCHLKTQKCSWCGKN